MSHVRLILPNQYFALPRLRSAVFFLAGPVRGGGHWQEEAIRMLVKQAPNSFVVCPCRYPPTHPLAEKYAVQGDPHKFPNQTLWERYYLKIASRRGAILFWLPPEDKFNPRDPQDGPYARETYGELGEWRMRIQPEGANVVIGAHKDFPGLRAIKRNYEALFDDRFAFHSTLYDTVNAAVKLAFS